MVKRGGKWAAVAAVLGLGLAGGRAGAQEAEPEPGGVLLGGKLGGVIPLGGLDPFLTVGVQGGWAFGAFGTPHLAALLDVSFTAPSADGGEGDPRLSAGSYTWEIDQRELILQPTLLYRLRPLGALVPSVGLGPRLYLLDTRGRGEAAGAPIAESREVSTRFGVGLPLALELPLGPGQLLGELLLEWAPLDHRVTGDASLLGVNLALGYRATL